MEPNGTEAPVGAPGKNVVNRRPRVGEIADTLRERIISGELQPGERLVEQTLANDLRVSRMPIREALNILRGQGFVSAIPNRGMVVRPLSDQDIENLFEVREVLDQLTARRAAERATDWEIEQMRMALEGGTTSLGADATGAHGRINQGFHDVLTAAALPQGVGLLMVTLGFHRLQQGGDGRLGTVGVWIYAVCMTELIIECMASVAAGAELIWGPLYPP